MFGLRPEEEGDRVLWIPHVIVVLYVGVVAVMSVCMEVLHHEPNLALGCFCFFVSLLCIATYFPFCAIMVVALFMKPPTDCLVPVFVIGQLALFFLFEFPCYGTFFAAVLYREEGEQRLYDLGTVVACLFAQYLIITGSLIPRKILPVTPWNAVPWVSVAGFALLSSMTYYYHERTDHVPMRACTVRFLFTSFFFFMFTVSGRFGAIVNYDHPEAATEISWHTRKTIFRFLFPSLPSSNDPKLEWDMSEPPKEEQSVIPWSVRAEKDMPLEE